jgi:hypothetical protein
VVVPLIKQNKTTVRDLWNKVMPLRNKKLLALDAGEGGSELPTTNAAGRAVQSPSFSLHLSAEEQPKGWTLNYKPFSRRLVLPVIAPRLLRRHRQYLLLCNRATDR